jgi:hypothetical protein
VKIDFAAAHAAFHTRERDRDSKSSQESLRRAVGDGQAPRAHFVQGSPIEISSRASPRLRVESKRHGAEGGKDTDRGCIRDEAPTGRPAQRHLMKPHPKQLCPRGVT